MTQSLPIRLPLVYERNLVHRLILSLLLLLAAASALGASEIVEAKIAEVTERGFILQTSSGALNVEDTSTTRFWRAKAAAKRAGFQAGDLITARLKTDCDPPQLRELADRPSWKWLDGVRKRA